MIRTILATVSVAFAAVTLAAPAAQACVSCEYKPEVLSASPGAGAKSHKRARVDKVVKARKQRPAKENVAERKASSRKAARAESRKTPSEAKETETTATVTTEGASEPTSTHSHSVYNTLIKTTEPIDRSPDAPVAVKPPVTSQGTPVATPPSTAAAPDVASPKKIDTAVAEPLIAEVPAQAQTAPAQPKTSGSSETISVSQDKGDKATGCKKFFPMADLTLTVDCK